MPRKEQTISGQKSKWTLSVVEHWCLYSRRTGFQPTGPHRRLLDGIFFRHWDKCKTCNGVGILDAEDSNDGKKWKECPSCQGLGGIYTAPEPEWNKMIILMMAEYPEYVCGDRKDEYWSIYLRHLNS